MGPENFLEYLDVVGIGSHSGGKGRQAVLVHLIAGKGKRFGKQILTDGVDAVSCNFYGHAIGSDI